MSVDFDQLKHELADVPIETIVNLIAGLREQYDEQREQLSADDIHDAAKLEEIAGAEMILDLAQLGMWIVEREQRSRRN